jgi:formyltetrahydrofolate deformylase
MSDKYILSLSCQDRPGLVAAVASFLAKNNCNILESQQFDDLAQNRFFMRIGFVCLASAPTRQELHQQFHQLAAEYAMDWRLRDTTEKRRVLVLVSKFDHCLEDLLYRVRIGELPMQIVGIVSNHCFEALNLASVGDIPWHYMPVTKATKMAQENQIKQVFEDTGAELVVLARYMQILSDDMSRYLSGRCINIHHSFLPGFKGAKPYHQAYDRGVKMIGATAHYVTTDLDEGPIICQDVENVSHADMPDDLIRKGRDIERRVLARAVHYHLEDRVLINSKKTVVFLD